MLDLAPDRLQRASGSLKLAVGRRAGRTRIAVLRQQGCLKLRFPRILADAPLQAVSVNCSGGIAAGDRLRTEVACAAGTRLLLTSQAAERCYRARALETASDIEASVRLDAGSQLEWLPQETILFDGARLRRRLSVDMAEDARLLCLESRVFGRTLHLERLHRLDLSDRVEIRRAGRLLLVDAFALGGDAETMLRRSATAAGGLASASVVLVAPGAEAMLDPVRAVLAGDAGASAWDGMLRVAMVSRDPAAHRVLIASVLAVLRDGAPLPSVWRC